MDNEVFGDRECPECEMESLIEHGLTEWKCTNPECRKVFDEEWLDYNEEAENKHMGEVEKRRR